MNPILKEILLGFLRHGITLVGGLFLAHKWITSDQMHWLASNEVVNWLFVFITASVVPVLFSVWATLKDRLRIKLAHLSAPTTTEKVINNQVSNAPISAILTTDPSKLV